MKWKFLLIVLLVAALCVGGFVIFSDKKAETTKTEIAVVKKKYYALGDSVAAGVGLYGASDSSACDRTSQSYPEVLAKELNFDLKNVACSGASINTGLIGEQNVNEAMVKPQLDQIYLLEKPELITITIGANDLGWIRIAESCYSGVCGNEADTLALQSMNQNLKENLAKVIKSIEDKYAQDVPKVIFTGYYQIFPLQKKECPELAGIAQETIDWWHEQTDKLNQTIENAVDGSLFADYAKPDFSGHELCSDNSWVQGLAADARYHPTEDGQKAMAAAVAKAYKSIK